MDRTARHGRVRQPRDYTAGCDEQLQGYDYDYPYDEGRAEQAKSEGNAMCRSGKCPSTSLEDENLSHRLRHRVTFTTLPRVKGHRPRLTVGSWPSRKLGFIPSMQDKCCRAHASTSLGNCSNTFQEVGTKREWNSSPPTVRVPLTPGSLWQSNRLKMRAVMWRMPYRKAKFPQMRVEGKTVFLLHY